MTKYIFLGFVLLFLSCKSKTDKMIVEFSDKIEQFEKQVDNLNGQESTDELMRTADELSGQIDALNGEDLSDKQDKMVGALALRLNIAIRTMQEKLTKRLEDTLQNIPSLEDSLKIQMLETDTI